MDEGKARNILGADAIQSDGGLYSLGWYLGWNTKDSKAVLDGRFSAGELEAIAWWMKNKTLDVTPNRG